MWLCSLYSMLSMLLLHSEVPVPSHNTSGPAKATLSTINGHSQRSTQKKTKGSKYSLFVQRKSISLGPFLPDIRGSIFTRYVVCCFRTADCGVSLFVGRSHVVGGKLLESSAIRHNAFWHYKYKRPGMAHCGPKGLEVRCLNLSLSLRQAISRNGVAIGS